jgi:hypothetical protein
VSAPRTPVRHSRRWRKRRRRALKNLRAALAEAGEQLSLDWVLRDPDLGSLRDQMVADPAWAPLLAQLVGAREKKPLTAKVPSRSTKAAVGVPNHPWPWFVPVAFWAAVTAVWVDLLWRAAHHDADWVFIAATIVGVVLSLGFLAFAAYKRLRRQRLVRRTRPTDGQPVRIPREG